jgi:arabinose-5-phosphate isomerase
MIKATAKKVLRIEAQAITDLITRIDNRFEKAVELLSDCKGRVVVTGMGKSGLIGRKIAATLASTGTPALFLHPGEGIHGDLGMITRGDTVVAISNSGETEELIRILPAIKRLRIPLICLTGNTKSSLAKDSDVVLDISVREEAGPLGLIPTASTAATLAIGDALTIALLERRGFHEEDFGAFHPGGSIGKKLLLRVKDVMHTGDRIPVVFEDTPLQDVIYEISSKKMGITTVKNRGGRVTGVVTDGDLRRLFEKESDPAEAFKKTAGRMMTRNPKTIGPDALAAQALQVMEQHSITALLVLDRRRLQGIVHLHDLLKMGVV